ncbi:Hypothetical predicted protein [Mytilus galloprovincialis]|uniref:DZIP3-like HEPN domain-containing protein n=1 Tax=Mytilus galloprovincialis TaxID=29158 RepID=A0A8B6DNH4_MYTGA|nr:Hypothetical predicted protein [Mytilus galloprovincialis]
MAEPAQTRYTRCRYAVGDVLTDIMREYLMYSKIPLTVIYKKIMGDDKFRKKLKQREIGQIQTLESHGFADSDISLMFKIARYHKFAMIIPDEPSHGWDSFPLETDNTFCDNILRIKSCRNEINHNPNTALSQNEFRRMFKMYIDIGRRSDKHLSKDNNHFTHRVENYETCSLDKEMEEKYKGEIENLKKIVESNPRPDITVKTYASKETQTKIDNIRAEELFEETSSAKITVSGIENAAKKAKQMNAQKDNFKTDYIEMKKATNGSLVLFLLINNRLFEDDMMESELERFVKTLFVTADLQCIQNHQCNIVLELEDGKLMI